MAIRNFEKLSIFFESGYPTATESVTTRDIEK